MTLHSKILGTLAMAAIGDAMGAATENLSLIKFVLFLEK